jgi:hypothetical protein
MGCVSCKTEKCKCSSKLCTNPLLYIIKNAFSLIGTTSNNFQVWSDLNLITHIPVTPPSGSTYIHTLATALTATLTSPVSFGSNQNICCPDCKYSVIGALANTNYIMRQELENILIDLNAKFSNTFCCHSHYARPKNWENFLDGFLSGVNVPFNEDISNKCCDSDFIETIQLWLDNSQSTTAYFYLDQLISEGFYESSSYNGYSLYGILFNFLKINHPSLNETDYLNILGIITGFGIRITCDKCSTIVHYVDKPDLIDDVISGPFLPGIRG